MKTESPFCIYLFDYQTVKIISRNTRGVLFQPFQIELDFNVDFNDKKVFRLFTVEMT